MREIQMPPGGPPPPRSGPLAGIRVADFCWMGVGSVATRMLADFGAEVIKIEDRNRLDMPRRLPIYKDDAARLRRGGPEPGPEQGRAVQQLLPQQARDHPQHDAPRGQGAVRPADRGQQRRHRELRAGRDGAVGPHLRAAARAAARRDLRADERLRPQRPAPRRTAATARSSRRSAGCRTSAACPDASRPAGGCPTWTTRPPTTTRRRCCMAIYHRNATGEGCEIDVSAVEVGINLLGPDLLDVARQRPARAGAPTSRRATGSSTRPPRRTASTRRPATTEWIAIAVFDDATWARARRRRWAARRGPPTPALATAAGRVARQDELDARLGAWTKNFDRARPDAPAAGGGRPRRRGAERRATSTRSTRRSPPAALFFELDHPVIGPARFEGQPDPVLPASSRTTGARRRCWARTTTTCSATLLRPRRPTRCAELRDEGVI